MTLPPRTEGAAPATGRDLARVRFLFWRDLFEPGEGLLSPRLIFPEPHDPLPVIAGRTIGLSDNAKISN